MKTNIGIKKEIFGLWDGDDRGYPTGNPLGFFPFEAAAASRKTNAYMVTRRENVVVFDDGLIYRVRKDVAPEKVKGKAEKFVPFAAYEFYVYENGFDKTHYIIGDEAALTFIALGGRHDIRRVDMLRDNEVFYVLEDVAPIKMTPFIASREMAIAHAMTKLTDEEKGLLGLK